MNEFIDDSDEEFQELEAEFQGLNKGFQIACDQLREATKKLNDIKPILKQIEESTNSRPPRVSLEELHLNEQWFRVWEILESEQTSEVKPQ